MPKKRRRAVDPNDRTKSSHPLDRNRSDVEEAFCTTLLCMNRLLGVPEVSRRIGEFSKAESTLCILNRINTLAGKYRTSYRERNESDFNAQIRELSCAKEHTAEICGYLSFYRQDYSVVDSSIWILGELCRFVAIRRYIASRSLDTIIMVVKIHSRKDFIRLQFKRFLIKLFRIEGLRSRPGSNLEIPTCDLLAVWRNQVVDKVLDAGFQDMLLGSPYVYGCYLVWRFLFLNLSYRPSSRHSALAPSFSSSMSLNNTPFRSTSADYATMQEQWKSWYSWMDPTYKN
jgi:hypothetical protein